jgi:hypothetical protein
MQTFKKLLSIFFYVIASVSFIILFQNLLIFILSKFNYFVGAGKTLDAVPIFILVSFVTSLLSFLIGKKLQKNSLDELTFFISLVILIVISFLITYV